MDYYRKVHNQSIDDMKQPLLMSQMKPRKGEGIRGESVSSSKNMSVIVYYVLRVLEFNLLNHYIYRRKAD